MNQAQPFPIIAYQNNPIFAYINALLTVQVIPGVPQATYAVTSGTLPPGITLNSTTGTLSGTPSMLVENQVVEITGTFNDSTTYTVPATFNVLNIPVPAQQSNQDSQAGLVALQEFRTYLFINEVNSLIANANALGKTWIFATVPEVVSFNTLQNYFQGLNYSIFPVNWRANRFQINTPVGEFYSSGEFYKGGPWGNPYYQLPRPGYPFLSDGLNRIKISWNPYPIGRYAPYYF